MSKPLPGPPKRYDLVESFDALALAGKKPTTDKRLPDLPRQPERTFARFIPRPFAPRVNYPRQPPSPGRVTPDAPTHPTGKQSLTMQYALDSLGPNTLAPPFVTHPPRPHSDSIVSPKAASNPPLSAVTRPAQPAVVIPGRPRAVSVPLSPATPPAGKNTAQCSSTTRVGKQCSRQVKLPITHSHLDPIPVVYCHQHKDVIISQPGFYIRKPASIDRFVEFSHYIPKYLHMDTQLALKVEMEKTTSLADVPGYIYIFEIRDPKRPDVIQLKVGRAVNLTKRLDEWDKQCGSKQQILRGWWPGTVEDGGTTGSLLKGNITPGDPGPFCHRVERLVHLELADLSLHTPYLNPSWPNNTLSSLPSSTHSPKRTSVKKAKCIDCGVVHREIFAFPRPDKGQYQGKEWDLIVKPVIEKWGRFVKEHHG